ncbi:MAG TPA: hypothetical protein VEJ23_04675 [Solirubrobacteraceae bacterium]|nr:hypothetical protein [Solirubrobacteraceae bacterium]
MRELGEEGFVGAAKPWHADEQERPVFVDDSGRRARAVYGAGVVMLALFATWLGCLVIGMFGATGFSVPRITAVVRTRAARGELASAQVVTAGSRALRSGAIVLDRTHAGCAAVPRGGVGAELLIVASRRDGTPLQRHASSLATDERGALPGCTGDARHEPRLT